MPLKYEQHGLDSKRLPFIFRCDVARKGMRDFTHWHENIEILFFTEGEGYVSCNFVPKPVKAGDIFVVNSENMHMVESDTFVRYYCFIIDTDFCMSNGIPTEKLRFRELINDKKMTESCIDVISAFEDVSDEYREAKIKLSILSLLVNMLSFIDDETKLITQENRNLPNIKLALRFIREHFTEDIGIDDISNAAGLSRTYFSHKFREITGFTTVNYVNLVRCQNACKMLRTGKYKINEVAIECGYDNFSYFTKTYKRLMGILPSEEGRGEK